MNNLQAISKEIEIVKNDILNRFPNCSYTINIILWDDNTYKIECRHGNDECTKIYSSIYYNNELTFEEVDIDGKVMIRNEFGEDKFKYLVDNIIV